jgi:hypothetical protein
VQRIFQLHADAQLKPAAAFAGNDQQRVQHSRTVTPMKRQAAGENRGAGPEIVDFDVQRCFEAFAFDRLPRQVGAAGQIGGFIRPSKPDSVVTVPRIARARLFRL